MLRIGNGYDVHKLVEGRRLMLGGVEVPHTKGVLGHSDGGGQAAAARIPWRLPGKGTRMPPESSLHFPMSY